MEFLQSKVHLEKAIVVILVCTILESIHTRGGVNSKDRTRGGVNSNHCIRGGVNSKVVLEVESILKFMLRWNQF